MPWWVVALRLTGLGWFVAFCVVGGIVGGWLLDSWAGTLPLFLLVGVVLGSATAFYGVYRMVLPLMKSDQPLDAQDGGQ